MPYKQKKLTAEQIENVQEACDILNEPRSSFSFWDNPEEVMLRSSLSIFKNVAKYGTSDGEPWKVVEVVPTGGDLGRKVWVRDSVDREWSNTYPRHLVGIDLDGRFLTQRAKGDPHTPWNYAILAPDGV